MIRVGAIVVARPFKDEDEVGGWAPVRDNKMKQIGTMLECDVAVVLSYEVPPRSYYTRGAWVQVLFDGTIGWVAVDSIVER